MDNENTKCKDVETELWYHSGESWDKKNCTKCVCFEGEISCMASVCAKPLCPNPVKRDGICCPVCPEEYEQGMNLMKGLHIRVQKLNHAAILTNVWKDSCLKLLN